MFGLERYEMPKLFSIEVQNSVLMPVFVLTLSIEGLQSSVHDWRISVSHSNLNSTFARPN